MRRLRFVLAVAVITGALLAGSAMATTATCTCGPGGLPYPAIALWSVIGAGGALAAYLGTGFARRRG